MARVVSSALTLGLIFWAVVIMPPIWGGVSVLATEAAMEAAPEWVHWFVGVGGVLAGLVSVWVWWPRMRRTSSIRVQVSTWTLLVAFPTGAVMIAGIVAIFMTEVVMFRVPGVLVVGLVPSALVAVVGSLVIYQTVKVVSQIPLLSISITLTMMICITIASMMLVLGASIINATSNWPLFYNWIVVLAILVVIGTALWMWLPRLAVAGITQGWLRAQLITFGFTVALFALAVFILILEVSRSPWALQPLVILAELTVMLTLLIVVPMRVSYFKPGYSGRSRDESEQAPETGRRAWFDPRANGWITAFSANMRAQNYQENRGHNPATDDWFEGWYSKAYIVRLFAPSDFISELRWKATEDFGCLRIVMDRLSLTVQRQWEVIKLTYIGRYSSDLNYEPSDFRNESISIATNRQEVICRNCGGDGTVYCPPTQPCRSCNGSNEIPCSTCGGRGYNRDFSSNSDGDDVTCYSCYGRSSMRCYSCSGGQVVCWLCGGSGRVRCGACDGAGIVVQAMVTVKTFTHTVDVNYQVEGLAVNEFKNGLKGNHFHKLQGTLVHQESQRSTEPGVIRQRLTAMAFYVYSCHYDYKGKSFILNHIYPSKYITQGLPWSWRRIAVGLAAASLLVAVVALLAWLL